MYWGSFCAARALKAAATSCCGLVSISGTKPQPAGQAEPCDSKQPTNSLWEQSSLLCIRFQRVLGKTCGPGVWPPWYAMMRGRPSIGSSEPSMPPQSPMAKMCISPAPGKLRSGHALPLCSIGDLGRGRAPLAEAAPSSVPLPLPEASRERSRGVVCSSAALPPAKIAAARPRESRSIGPGAIFPSRPEVGSRGAEWGELSG
mmetsp:Transcript_25078/g.74581  ORF Transcript_25078/g.74581 Transcript_25078/m.74581 type:complete len:202 (-) Transcript_25078:8-613(-)